MVADETRHPQVVYLDMNVWVWLARGCLDGDPSWVQMRDRMELASQQGRLVFPLTAAHYLELWHRGSGRSREQVGAHMRDLSGYRSLLPAHAVRTDEVEEAVLRRLGSRSTAPRHPVLGRGAVHAFASPFGRFRFVESLASVDGSVPEGQPVDAPRDWPLHQCSGPTWEWMQLVGTEEILESVGIERAPEHRHGTANVLRESGLRERLIASSQARARLWDIVVADEIVALWPDIEHAASSLGASPLEIFLGPSATGGPPDAMRSLVESVPSAYVWSRLRYAKHRDLSHPWEQHDWTDIAALSVAIPYCDVVITERRWAHMARAMGIDRRFGTLVCSGSRGLASVLDRADR